MHAVVVGGGIIGLASAYYLADRGVPVTVCEKSTVGAGSTERSAGGIRAQYSTPVNVDLSVAAMEVWADFEERFGADIAYRRTGYLFLAREAATARQFREDVRLQNDRGVDSEFLAPEEAVEHCRGLDPDRFVGATYHDRDGFADPHLALQAFARAAADAGAEIRTQTPVVDVRREGGRVVGVETPDGPLDADVVVNAAGPWAREVAHMAGVDLPVRPKRRQLAVVEPGRPVPETDPLTIDLDSGSYFRPERDGNALVGGHFGRESRSDSDGASGGSASDASGDSSEPRSDGERSDPRADPDEDPDAYRESFDVDWAADAVEAAAEWTDYFGPESRIRRGWAGLYAVTPDHHPVIEETVKGFVNAVGFSGHGFQHAPATGQVVAELVVDGAASLVDVSPLSSDRFADGDLIDERNVA